MKNIRNISIIAHIDHGKSTLADRLIEKFGDNQSRQIKDQILDSMDLERERGITIKAQTVTLNYNVKKNDYQINLIDTPGHVDFSYEVSRSLSASDGALLIVDATQGIEAQSIAHTELAQSLGLTIIPIINKIDLPSAYPSDVKKDLANMLQINESEILEISAKSGLGVENIIPEVIKKVPTPKTENHNLAKAGIIDSWFDKYLGVVTLVKIISGTIEPKQKIQVLSNKREFIIDKVGIFTPQIKYLDKLKSGEVGFIIASIKNLDSVQVGDTVIDVRYNSAKPIPGFKKIQPRVFSGFYPVDSKNYQESKKALDKLSLNDTSFTYEPENSQSLGHGFRCGFLGLLHMEIIRERVQREYNLEFLMTIPSVTYKIENKKGEIIYIKSPRDLPDSNQIKDFYEPIALIKIITPQEYLGSVIDLCIKKRAKQTNVQYLSKSVEIQFEIPLSEIIFDFFDKLKSYTKGYASYDYEIIDYRISNMLKLDILVNKKKIDALSQIMHKEESQKKSRTLIENLKELIPRQNFEITIQGCVGSKILSSTSIKGYRKDVTAKLYGGDVTRKMKLLEKQKEGKKKMKKIGNVEIPREAFYKFMSPKS
ncbi:MAG: elongation factor 4 [Gammaproteobacteria bacterium]|nr:elongation factor 4 [Gammaproteobacteria bacterium]|tara:strand:+ start:1252 stop:3039 length:1788 start_codon:yes stop_codon:yes gene_type:complete